MKLKLFNSDEIEPMTKYKVIEKVYVAKPDSDEEREKPNKNLKKSNSSYLP